MGFQNGLQYRTATRISTVLAASLAFLAIGLLFSAIAVRTFWQKRYSWPTTYLAGVLALAGFSLAFGWLRTPPVPMLVGILVVASAFLGLFLAESLRARR